MDIDKKIYGSFRFTCTRVSIYYQYMSEVCPDETIYNGHPGIWACRDMGYIATARAHTLSYVWDYVSIARKKHRHREIVFYLCT